MRGKSPFIGLRVILAIFAVALFVRGAQAATRETLLYSFNNYFSGSTPYSGVIFDDEGNLYGTTTAGGVPGEAVFKWGTVFELLPGEGGSWTEKVLHSFGTGADGRLPSGHLTFDRAGNLYGATGIGGTYGDGTVFELTPTGSGGWTEAVLHNFGNGTDGMYPNGSLIFDAAGNLYGMTNAGGTNGQGAVFELSPNVGGGWTETVLYNFSYTDGQFPVGGLIMDPTGNLYGATYDGGNFGYGTVFELSPTTGGGWAESALYSFGNGMDGQNPTGAIMDSAGNLYGTTENGGIYNNGTVFELSPTTGGGWTESVLYSFGNGVDGHNPEAVPIFDLTGHLYGTTQYGGRYTVGTVFELSPTPGGGWTEIVLHDFGNGTDGFFPYYAGLIIDVAGNLYGTTSGGGINGSGTVFQIAP